MYLSTFSQLKLKLATFHSATALVLKRQSVVGAEIKTSETQDSFYLRWMSPTSHTNYKYGVKYHHKLKGLFWGLEMLYVPSYMFKFISRESL